MDILEYYLLEPLSYPFMQRALIVSVSIGLVCSIFSCFLILKGWSLMGDAVSHAVLPGIALAYVVGIPLFIGAFIAGLFCAVTIGYVKEHSRVKEDAVMGIIFSGMFALGLVMLTKIQTDVHLLHILFGNVLGLTSYDLMETVIIAGSCTAIMILKRRDLMLFCFDPVQARIVGLSKPLLHFGLLILLSLTIVSSLKAAGIILVIAMLITPGAVGFLLARSFDRMMVISVTTSIFSCITGTILSYHMDVATAPLIVMIQSLFFLCALGASLVRNHRKVTI